MSIHVDCMSFCSVGKDRTLAVVGTGFWKVLLQPVLVLTYRECLHDWITACTEAEVKCAFQNDTYKCDAVMTEREIRGVSH